jgi:Protein of unknown function (DUF2911)
MRKLLILSAAFLVTLCFSSSVLHAQKDKTKRLSPPATAKYEFSSGKSITIDYSSPRVRNRKIFGGLVPYNEVWRAGANEATTFVTTTDLEVGGKRVPAGSYTLFVLPAEHEWTLIISKKTGEWGIPYPGEKFDFLRVPMKLGETPAHVEDFTISFDKAGKGCTLKMEWERTRATIAIEPI